MTHLPWIIPFAVGTAFTWEGMSTNNSRYTKAGIVIMALVFIARLNAP